MLDEGRNQSLAPTLTPVGFGDVEGIEQHRPLTVRMDEFVPVHPASYVVAALKYQQCRLGPRQERCRVDLAVQTERPARLFRERLITGHKSSDAR
jgi:hypothetical protein